MSSHPPFFLRREFCPSSPRTASLRVIIPAFSIAGNISLAKSHSLAVYLEAFPLTGLASSVKSIECFNKSVACTSFTDSAKQSFQVYNNLLAFSTRSGVSALGPMIIPLDAHQYWITLSGAVLRLLSCGLRCVGN